jgi:acetyltransferase-like isoleucine patch superfamily enzyme
MAETVVVGNPAKVTKKIRDLRYAEDPTELPY